MAQMNDAQRQMGRDAVAQALTALEAPATHAEAVHSDAAALAGIDPKDFFCKNWATVKSVLQFLKDFLPVLVRPVVAIIIAAGDALHGAICK